MKKWIIAALALPLLSAYAAQPDLQTRQIILKKHKQLILANDPRGQAQEDGGMIYLMPALRFEHPVNILDQNIPPSDDVIAELSTVIRALKVWDLNLAKMHFSASSLKGLEDILKSKQGNQLKKESMEIVSYEPVLMVQTGESELFVFCNVRLPKAVGHLPLSFAKEGGKWVPTFRTDLGEIPFILNVTNSLNAEVVSVEASAPASAAPAAPVSEPTVLPVATDASVK